MSNQMSTRNILRKFKMAFVDLSSHLAFLIMFAGVVIGPLVLLIIGGRSLNTSGQSYLLLPIILIALLLIVSIGGGFLLFRHGAYIGKGLSINSKGA